MVTVYNARYHQRTEVSLVVACAVGPTGVQSIFRQPLVLKSTSLYALVGLLAVLFDEVFGLFCKARREDGGLGFVSAQIGLCFSVMGVLLLMYQRAYRHVNNRIGSVRVCQVRRNRHLQAVCVAAWPSAGS